MEAISVQQENTMQELEGTYLQQREQLIEVNIEMENCTHELWVQIQELEGKLKTLHTSHDKAFQPTYLDNRLKEFLKLFVDNALLKV